MLQDLALRRAALAYLYRETPPLTREHRLKFYDRVTASGVELHDLSIQGPELVLKRPSDPAKGSLEVRVGPFGTPPQFRLLISDELGDRPLQLAYETAGLVWEAFEHVWGASHTQPTLTEVTLNFSSDAPGGQATDFLLKDVAQIKPSAISRLGRKITAGGLLLESSPTITLGRDAVADSLGPAELRVRLETLRRDHTQLYIETMARWPAISLPVDQLPDAIREQVDGPVLQVNRKADPPQVYLEGVYNFVTERVVDFLREAKP